MHRSVDLLYACSVMNAHMACQPASDGWTPSVPRKPLGKWNGWQTMGYRRNVARSMRLVSRRRCRYCASSASLARSRSRGGMGNSMTVLAPAVSTPSSSSRRWPVRLRCRNAGRATSLPPASMRTVLGLRTATSAIAHRRKSSRATQAPRQPAAWIGPLGVRRASIWAA